MSKRNPLLIIAIVIGVGIFRVPSEVAQYISSPLLIIFAWIVGGIICLLGVTGNIERPGSMLAWMPPDTGLREDFFTEIPITDEMRKDIVGSDKFKMGAARTAHSDTVIKQLLNENPVIKVWFSVGGQQILHLANTTEVIQAFKNQEFMVTPPCA